MPRRLTTKAFIEKAEEVHGKKYDYSKVVYVNNNTKVEIICPEHGSFWQLPRTHVSAKCECPKCSGVYSDKESFVEKSNSIHSYKYDYSKVEYVDAKTKVCIICPEHGEFKVSPNAHISSFVGCPKCSKMKRASERDAFIYGVARNDYKGSCVDENGKLIKSYNIWYGMIRRCYDHNSLLYKKTYTDCTVCDEWLYFSNFKEWFDENYIEGYALDKDILVHGNRVYSPNTCCFVPDEINTIFIKNERNRGDYLIGVYSNGNQFSARLTMWGKEKYLGCFNTEEDAFLAYKREKETFIKEVAELYKNRITQKVYDALMKYEVLKTD